MTILVPPQLNPRPGSLTLDPKLSHLSIHGLHPCDPEQWPLGIPKPEPVEYELHLTGNSITNSTDVHHGDCALHFILWGSALGAHNRREYFDYHNSYWYRLTPRDLQLGRHEHSGLHRHAHGRLVFPIRRCPHLNHPDLRALIQPAIGNLLTKQA